MVLGIFDLYHKRKKQERGEFPDIYEYDKLPQKLKVQIVHIWKDMVPPDPVIYGYLSEDRLYGQNKESMEIYKLIHSVLLKEEGVFELPLAKGSDSASYYSKVANFFLQNESVEDSLSIIELFFKVALLALGVQAEESEGVHELNGRFKEHGIGYQFEGNQIIRVDSQVIHTDVVKPTLQLLSNPMYKGAQEEFLKAHEFYRKQDYKNMMVECLKAYESVLKVIIQKHNWGYDRKDTADALTGKVMNNGLIPDYWKNYFKNLKNTLTGGLPTVRNNEAGHGQGEIIKNPPDYLAAYVLHMTASAILFLTKAEESLP